MKILKSVTQDKKQKIEEPKKNMFLFVVLVIMGLVIDNIGIGIGGIIGIAVFLAGNAFIIAGVMQCIGTSECVCPNCETKGYIFKYAKNYKCKTCENISIVVEDND